MSDLQKAPFIKMVKEREKLARPAHFQELILVSRPFQLVSLFKFVYGCCVEIGFKHQNILEPYLFFTVLVQSSEQKKQLEKARQIYAAKIVYSPINYLKEKMCTEIKESCQKVENQYLQKNYIDFVILSKFQIFLRKQLCNECNEICDNVILKCLHFTLQNKINQYLSFDYFFYFVCFDTIVEAQIMVSPCN